MQVVSSANCPDIGNRTIRQQTNSRFRAGF